MSYKEYSERLNYLLEMVKNGRVSGLEPVAGKFGCSVRTVKRMIHHLKEEGHSITYSKRCKKYFLGK